MSIVTIKLNNKHFSLDCDKASEPNLLRLAENLDLSLMETKEMNKTAPFEMVLVLTALRLQNMVLSQNNADRDPVMASTAYENPTREFSDDLASIARYLENLAGKLEGVK